MSAAQFSSTEPLWWNPPLWLLPLLAAHISFNFSKALLYSAFCFKAPALITLAHDVSFAWRLSLRPGSGEYLERWFVLMMGGNKGERWRKGGKWYETEGEEALSGGMWLMSSRSWLKWSSSNLLPFSSLSIVYISIRIIFASSSYYAVIMTWNTEMRTSVFFFSFAEVSAIKYIMLVAITSSNFPKPTHLYFTTLARQHSWGRRRLKLRGSSSACDAANPQTCSELARSLRPSHGVGLHRALSNGS